MLYIAEISKFPNCIIFKSLTLQKGKTQLVRKLLFQRVILIWGLSSELHGDKGTHFTGQIVDETCKIWLIMQHFHCTCHPQSSGLVERKNGTV